MLAFTRAKTARWSRRAFTLDCTARRLWLQIHDFMGIGKSSKATLLTTSKSVMKRVARTSSSPSSPQRYNETAASPTDSSPSKSPPGSPAASARDLDPTLWKSSRLLEIVRSICWEIQFSLGPLALRRWMDKNRLHDVKMVSLFCLTAWVGPHIPDDAAVSAYSKSPEAKVFKKAAKEMPRLILAAAFGDDEVALNMKYFLEQLKNAQKTISKDDLRILDNVAGKDRGPFLYWLLEERIPIGCLRPPAHARARMRVHATRSRMHAHNAHSRLHARTRAHTPPPVVVAILKRQNVM